MSLTPRQLDRLAELYRQKKISREEVEMFRSELESANSMTPLDMVREQILQANQDSTITIKFGLAPKGMRYVYMQDRNLEADLELIWYRTNFPVPNPKYTGQLHSYPRAVVNTLQTCFAADRSYMVKCDMVLYPGSRAGVWVMRVI